MNAPWGPALDAEVAYRHEQIRAQFGRRRRFGRHHATPDASPTIAPVARTATAPAGGLARIPAQRTVTAEPAATTVDRAGRRAA